MEKEKNVIAPRIIADCSIQQTKFQWTRKTENK